MTKNAPPPTGPVSSRRFTEGDHRGPFILDDIATARSVDWLWRLFNELSNEIARLSPCHGADGEQIEGWGPAWPFPEGLTLEDAPSVQEARQATIAAWRLFYYHPNRYPREVREREKCMQHSRSALELLGRVGDGYRLRIRSELDDNARRGADMRRRGRDWGKTRPNAERDALIFDTAERLRVRREQQGRAARGERRQTLDEAVVAELSKDPRFGDGGWYLPEPEGVKKARRAEARRRRHGGKDGSSVTS